MKTYIIGIGMNGEDTITREGERCIRNAEILIGAKRMLAPFQMLGKTMFCTYRTDEILRIIQENPGKTIAVLMSGDCGFYSGAKQLAEKLAYAEIVCGISSPIYLCSKTGLDWEEMQFFSLHGKEENIAVNVKLHRRCFFLLGGRLTAKDVCRKLCDYGLSDAAIYIGENLGYENEHITTGTAKDLVSLETSDLCVLIAENKAALQYVPSCIRDDAFIRGNVPMTKAEIRSLCVAKLHIRSGDICFDCGCGTGSVAVEMAYRCPDGRVYGFDVNAEAVELTKQNSIQFGCDNLVSLHGDTTEQILAHPEIVPDKAFIGGSGGKLRELVTLLMERNPEIRLVLTAVTLETLHQATVVLDELGAESTVSQISVVHTRRVGASTMMQAQNPVFIIEGKRKCEES